MQTSFILPSQAQKIKLPAPTGKADLQALRRLEAFPSPDLALVPLSRARVKVIFTHAPIRLKVTFFKALLGREWI